MSSIICIMKSQSLFYFKGLSFLIWIALLLSACQASSASPTPLAEDPQNGVTPLAETQAIATSAPTSVEPSPTARALAAKVNQLGIPLETYEMELKRFQAVVNRELTGADRQRVLDGLIHQLLLSQAALENGFNLDRVDFEQRLSEVVESAGGQEAFNQWLEANFYSEASFREQLALDIEAAWMRDQIIAQVPDTAEQVHARQILSRTAEEAQQVFTQLQAGADFDNLAKTADPIAGGELGWFPRGYLFFPELDEAIFQLQPEQFTNIIQTPSGYHIVLVTEREAQRPLDSQIQLVLKEKALQKWLEERRRQSNIEVLVPIGDPGS